MGVLNNMPNVRITRVHSDSHINFGTTTNVDRMIIDKSLGSSTTIGESGINLDFEKNLFIRIRPR